MAKKNTIKQQADALIAALPKNQRPKNAEERLALENLIRFQRGQAAKPATPAPVKKTVSKKKASTKAAGKKVETPKGLKASQETLDAAETSLRKRRQAAEDEAIWAKGESPAELARKTLRQRQAVEQAQKLAKKVAREALAKAKEEEKVIREANRVANAAKRAANASRIDAERARKAVERSARELAAQLSKEYVGGPGWQAGKSRADAFKTLEKTVHTGLVNVVQSMGTQKPEERAKVIASLRSSMLDETELHREWMAKDMKDLFEQGFKDANPKGTISKADRSAFYRIRSKFQESNDQYEQTMVRSLKGYGTTLDKKAASWKPGDRKNAEWIRMETQKIENGFSRELIQVGDGVRDTTVKFFNSRPVFGARYRNGAMDPTFDTKLISIGHHGGMLSNVAGSRAYNLGFLRGALGSGSEYVYVLDGPDCGWKTHKDQDKANGKRVTLKQASLYPISHPNCRRSFSLTKPPTDGEKQKEEKKASRAGKAKKVAKVAAITAGAILGAATVEAAYTNLPVLYRLKKNDLRDVIPSWREYDRRIAKLASDLSREDSAGIAGALRTGVTMQAARERALGAIEQFIMYGTEIPASIAQFLGQDVTTSALFAKIEDLSDYVRYSANQVELPEDLLRNFRVVEQANEAIIGNSDMAAIRFHLQAPPGVNLGGMNKQTMQTLKDAFLAGTDPQIAQHQQILALLKEVGVSIDPFPVLNARMGKASFWIRSNAAQRRQFAEKIYARYQLAVLQKEGALRVAAAEAVGIDDNVVSLAERKIFKQYGSDVSAILTKQDVLDALTPRVTLNPGGLFSATLAREKIVNAAGEEVTKLKFAAQVLPKGKLKFLKLRTRFQDSTITSAIELFREGDTNGALALLRETLITDLDVLRNSPFHFNLRTYGTRLQSYGIKLNQDGEVLRLNNRIRNFERRWVTEEGIAPHFEDFFDDGFGNVIRFPLGQGPTKDVYTASTWLTSVIAMPGKAASLAWSQVRTEGVTGLTVAQSVYHETILKLRLFRGNIFHVARDLSIVPERLIEDYRNALESFRVAFDKLTPEKLRNISSLQELDAYIEQIKKPGVPRAISNRAWSVERTIAEGFPGNIDLNTPLGKDIRRVYASIEGEFPRLPSLPEFRIAAGTPQDAFIHYSMTTGDILVDPVAAKNWKVVNELAFRQSVSRWIAGVQGSISTVMHETGHFIAENLDPMDKLEIFNRILDADVRIAGRGGQVLTTAERLVSDAASAWDGIGTDATGARQRLEDLRKAFSGKLGDKRKRHQLADQVMNDMLAYVGDPDKVTNAARVANVLSELGATNINELLAEAFSEFMTSSDPGILAEIVGRYFKEIYG